MPDNSDSPPRDESVTAVIPVYNEAQYVGALLNILCQVNILSEIIVVDDCSTDATAEIVRSYGHKDERIHLIRLPENAGKGGALAAGAQVSASDLLVFLDADLISVRPDHILNLIEPVRNGTCSMSIALFKRGRLQTDLSHRLTPFLSGQRCVDWSLYKHTPEFAAARWGAEVALSLFARQNKLEVQTVTWSGVTHVMRPEKAGGLDGLWSHVQMWADIAAYILKYSAVFNGEKLINALRTTTFLL